MLSPFSLVDFERIWQISQIRETKQPFDAGTPWDQDGMLSAECTFSSDITLSQEGRFEAAEAYGSPGYKKAAQLCKQKHHQRSDTQRAIVLKNAVRLSCFGLLWERLFWVIHEAIVDARESNVSIPLPYLRSLVWSEAYPQHWRTALLKMCCSLRRLQIWDQADSPADACMFLNTRVDQTGKPSECKPSCRWRGQGKHEHLHVYSGPAALGILEALWNDNEDGTRSFPVEDDEDRASINKRWNEQLSKIGKTGRLTQIYLPAVLGKRTQVRKLKPSGHRLLQVIIREATRPATRPNSRLTPHGSGLALAEIQGNKVPDNQKMVKGVAKGKLDCPFLEATEKYVGFNGNGLRPGQGYKLNTWAEKARYLNPVDFIAELHRIAELLGLIVAVFDPKTGEWKSAIELEAIAKSHPTIAKRYYLRVYALTGFRQQWDEFFGWDSKQPTAPPEENAANARALLAKYGVNQSQAAKLLGVDRSHFSKLLTGKRKMKAETLTQLEEVLKTAESEGSDDSAIHTSDTPAIKIEPVTSHIVDPELFHEAVISASEDQGALMIAQKYLSCGWSIVPQLADKKKPAVKWKQYQTKRPTASEVESWWQKYPDAGVALIAGPLSGVLVIDVDGSDAHDELVSRLGTVPDAPRVNSGSDDPDRYHIYFQHPNFATKAKAIPWHPNLEFRGHGGLLILPPSLHKSGNQYRWTEESQNWTGPLPQLPESIVEVLQSNNAGRATGSGRNRGHDNTPENTSPEPVPADLDCCRETRRFLQGDFADGPRWNDRLYEAACDLHARGIEKERAVLLLERGARPRDSDNRETMIRTIESAFSEERSPSPD